MSSSTAVLLLLVAVSVCPAYAAPDYEDSAAPIPRAPVYGPARCAVRDPAALLRSAFLLAAPASFVASRQSGTFQVLASKMTRIYARF